ncbi:YgfZ/GcvT domain-containing protein [Sphingomonas solaris]|uniref:Folate-binding protein YgfZ n=1 Tax=Alterirhizorhabdus solaris TaxID=2529389 RepID=A0A558R5E8_9SPHN|nr:folate-binding protein YgfZ [Sphingomonas solaris]TVV74578.1 folate-binding protein YgfZ [Sphingomonas solaris]
MSGTTLIDRAVVRLSGEDVRGFLQGLVTGDVAGPLPVWAGLLTPQGKALFDFLIWADGEDLLIDCEAAQADALVRRLSLYRLRRAITIARDPSLAVHWAAAGEAGVPDPRLASLGRRWIAPADGAADGWREHRLRLGVAEGVDELGTDKTLWLEANARELNGVSFIKGCYVGQENTARMHHRSKVNRRLVVMPAAEPNDRTRIVYPDLGLAVEHRRMDALEGALRPDWLAAAIAADAHDT